jgi:hypothetical protein
MLIPATPRLGRTLFVFLTMVAWLSISNHCVLGSVIALGQVAEAPMHCHGDSDTPTPSKNSDEAAPCCKILKAVVVAKISAGVNQLDFVWKDYPSSELTVAIWQAHTHTLELDTGPPPAVSFSESVLQRSILAHAPPSLS